jgi:hypothetical protein
MQPSSTPAQASAKTLLEAYILDYLRRAGCEDLAGTAGERWQTNADLPGMPRPPALRNSTRIAELHSRSGGPGLPPSLPHIHPLTTALPCCSAPNPERHPAGLVDALLEAGVAPAARRRCGALRPDPACAGGINIVIRHQATRLYRLITGLTCPNCARWALLNGSLLH